MVVFQCFDQSYHRLWTADFSNNLDEFVPHVRIQVLHLLDNRIEILLVGQGEGNGGVAGRFDGEMR